MSRVRGVVYGAVVVLVSVGFLPLLAQVQDSGRATAGIGVWRRGFTVCYREAHGSTCTNYTFGPCGACHDLKANAVFDEKTEATHRNDHWVPYQQNIAPDQQIQFGGISVKLVSGTFVALNSAGRKLATFPVGTKVLKDKNGGLWIFFPPKPLYYLSPELEAAIKSGLQSQK